MRDNLEKVKQIYRADTKSIDKKIHLDWQQAEQDMATMHTSEANGLGLSKRLMLQ